MKFSSIPLLSILYPPSFSALWAYYVFFIFIPLNFKDIFLISFLMPLFLFVFFYLSFMVRFCLCLLCVSLPPSYIIYSLIYLLLLFFFVVLSFKFTFIYVYVSFTPGWCENLPPADHCLLLMVLGYGAGIRRFSQLVVRIISSV